MNDATGPGQDHLKTGHATRHHLGRWLSVAALSAVATVGLWKARTVEPMVRLVSAAPRDVRFVEPRISGGFRWAPLAQVSRGASDLDPIQMTLAGAAGQVLEETAGDESLEARHTAAIAHLLAGDAATAIDTLERVSKKSRDASVWNDMAAAYYLVAIQKDSSAHLEDALATGDQALRFDPKFPEALFNRALVLERFHLRDAAADAWKMYLAADPNGPWSLEARSHFDKLSRPLATFSSEIERQYSALQSGDRKAADMLVRIDAGEARYFGQTEGLARWAEAFLRADTAAADRHLTAIRTLAAALQAFNREVLLSEAVDAIDRASAPARETLAHAHVAFREGRRLFRQERKPTDAEKSLIAAALGFVKSGSPMAHEANVYAAVAIFGQGRFKEAEVLFQQLEKSASSRYAALRAYILWQQASCFMARADWGETITLLNGAIEAFDRLREPANAAYLRDIISQVYDAVGDQQRASRSRFLALQELGKTTTYRLEHAVSGMVHDATQRKDWMAALSFCQIEIHIARQVRDKELQTAALLHRALIFSHTGDSEAAEAGLREAASVVSTVDDPALRAKLEMDRTTAAELVSRSPETAIPLLTEALGFHNQKGWRMLAPELYLRRGRMHKARGDAEQARRDFDTGIEVLETHRGSIPAGEQRWGALDAAEELFDEAIAAALVAGPEPAFEYAERKRARSLSDHLGDAGGSIDPATLSREVLIVEYAALPERLLVFVVTRDGYRVEEKKVRRETLVSLVETFSAAVRNADGERRQALTRSVYELLIAPVGHLLASHPELIFVPDATTSSVAFAALSDGRSKRAMIDDHTISVLPSARMYVHARGNATVKPRTSVLIVDSPTQESMPRLPYASSEAEDIAAEYAVARRLSGRDATVNALVEHGRESEVLHFAGHGQSGKDTATLLFTPDADQSGSVDAATISRLRLDNTSVVVLAACDSARGPVRAAEGVVSVAHAFLQAGVPAVIATLWPISDRDSADFFPRLHRHLASGKPPAEALRLAQLEYIRESTEDRSNFWAAVQSIGY